MDLNDVLVEPIMSEKSWLQQDDRQYTFRVHPSANKLEIREAVETIFNVEVQTVRTMNMRGKPRSLRFDQEGRQASWKKAVVQLAPGDRIDLQQ
ncbi:MAG: 50S ribosomal protein L23 [Candidatus Bipolaricaulia bacterium]